MTGGKNGVKPVKPILKFILNALLSLLVLALCLALTEWALQKTVFNYDPYAKPEGPGIPYTIQTLDFKITMLTNSLDLRGPEIPPKEAGEFRIFCLGDSFTYGMGVEFEEAYPAVLEGLLRGKNPGVRVFNTGQNNAIKERYDFMSRTGVSLKPDWVVLQIFIGNDFYDGLKAEENLKREAASAGNGPAFKQRLKDYARERSAVMRLVWHAAVGFRWADDWLRRHNLRLSNQGIYLSEYPALEKKLVKFHQEHFEKLTGLLRREGIGVTVLIVPDKMQVLKAHLLPGPRYDLTKPNRIIRRACEAAGIEVLDMLDVYQAMDMRQKRRLYFRQDLHWTRSAHREAAERLAEMLSGQLPS